MYINNTEALKVWLTAVLEPLCDADPAALARYVLALLKKDKPEKDLIVSMKEQLDVFLSEQTLPFLERLFKVIKSEEYLKCAPAVSAGTPPVSNGATATAAAASSTTSPGDRAQQATVSVTLAATSHASSNHHHAEEVSSSSRMRIKREFTPPLQETRSSKDALPSSATSNYSSGSSSSVGVGTTTASGSTVSGGSSTSERSTSHHHHSEQRTEKGRASEMTSSSVAHTSSPSVSSSSGGGGGGGGTAGTATVGGVTNQKSTSTHHQQHSPIKGSSSKDDHSNSSSSTRRSRRMQNRSRSRTRSRSRSFERTRDTRRSRSRELQQRTRGGGGAGGGSGNGGSGNDSKSSGRSYRNKSPLRSSDSFRRYERKGYDRRNSGPNASGGSNSGTTGSSATGVASGSSSGNGVGSSRSQRIRSHSRSHSPSPNSDRRKIARSMTPVRQAAARGAGPSTGATVSGDSVAVAAASAVDAAVLNPVAALVPAVTGGVPIIPVGGGTVVPTIAPVPAPSVGSLDRALNATAGEGGAVSAVPLGGSSSKRQRCRDFDEKGYCMRGETCPWDHGTDPVVLDGLSDPAMIAQMRGTIVPEYSPDAPELWNKPPNIPGGPIGGVPAIRPGPTQRLGGGIGGFGPRGGPVGMGLTFRGVAPVFPMQGFPGNPIGATPLQRELISVPVVDANKGGDVSADHRNNRFEPEDAVAIADGPMVMGGGGKRKMPNRHGPRGGGHAIVGGPGGPGIMLMNPQHNCSLELRKIPRGLNEISHLNDHFSKFGKITNIQIRYDNDPEAAIVTFTSHAEANVAYRSTEAVLNNRFIKVFWHIPPAGGEQPAITAPAKTEHSLRRSYPNQYSINNNLSTTGATGTTQTGPTVAGGKTLQAKDDANGAPAMANGNENLAPQQQIGAGGPKGHGNSATKYISPGTGAPLASGGAGSNKISRAQNEMLRKKQEEFNKGINDRKVILMDGYLKEQRKLLELIVTYDSSDPRRSHLKESLDELQVKINNLGKEIQQDQQLYKANAARGPAHGPKHKTKAQHEREQLDAELEQIAQEQRTFRAPDGPAAPAPGQKPYGPGSRKGAGSVVRVAPPGSTSVDRRPTTILITGFVEEEAESLLEHFKQFGEVTKHQLDKVEPSLTISFSTRPVAEKALARGKQFNKKLLSIVWQTTAAVAPSTPTGASAPNVVAATPADTGKDERMHPLVHSSSGGSDGDNVDDALTSTKLLDIDESSDGADRMVLIGSGGVGTDINSSSMETLNETDELIEMPHMVEEEEDDDDMEGERSWRR